MKIFSAQTMIALLLVLSVNVAQAETKVFGLTLRKSTDVDVKTLYKDAKASENGSIFGGGLYDIPTENISFSDLQGLAVATGDEGVVVNVFAIVSQSKLDFLVSSLNEKYHVVKKELPRVGDKYVEYENDGDVIILEAPHMSFDAKLSYYTKSAYQTLLESRKKRAEDKKQQEASQL